MAQLQVSPWRPCWLRPIALVIYLTVCLVIRGSEAGVASDCELTVGLTDPYTRNRLVDLRAREAAPALGQLSQLHGVTLLCDTAAACIVAAVDNRVVRIIDNRPMRMIEQQSMTKTPTIYMLHPLLLQVTAMSHQLWAA